MSSPGRRLISAARLSCLHALLASLSACGDDPVITPGPEPLPAMVWTRIAGGFGVDSLLAVWGSSPEQVFVACNAGVLRDDGTRWRLETLPGSAPRPRSLWGTSASRLFAVGEGGAIWSRAGGSWASVPSPVTTDLNDVGGASPTRIYACGAGAGGDGVLLGYDGAAWTLLETAPVELTGVWAGGADSVFVVGREGYFALLAGDSLRELAPDAAVDLHDVWGPSAHDVYAVGDLGTVFHFDGAQTALVATGGTEDRRAVGGSAPDDVHITGVGGTLHHFDGNAWSAHTVGLGDAFVGVWGFAGGEAVAVSTSGSVVEYENAQWRVRLAGFPYRLRAAAFDILVGEAPGGGVAIVGDETYTFPGALHAVSAFGTGDAYAVGAAGGIYHFDGALWSPEPVTAGADLNGITGLRNLFGLPMRLYAVGDAGTVLVWKGTADAWKPAVLPAEAGGLDLTDVWAAAIDDVFAVASNSTRVLRYDDPDELAPWTVEPTPATGPLVAVGGRRGDTYAVSSLGEIIHHDGGGWKKVAQTRQEIRDIQVVARGEFHAVGNRGLLAYYKDGRWATFEPDYAGDFLSVWARSGWNPLAVGTNGAVWVLRPN